MTPRDRPLATHFEDFLGEPLSGSNQLDEVERQLRAQLVRLNEEHQQRIKPLVDQLVRIQCLRAPRHLLEAVMLADGMMAGDVMDTEPARSST